VITITESEMEQENKGTERSGFSWRRVYATVLFRKRIDELL